MLADVVGNIQAAKQVCCGVNEVVVEDAAPLLVEFCAETVAATARATTVVKKRMLQY